MLWPHQIECNNAIVTAYDQGWRQQIVSMATGAGKTWTFSALYEQLKSRLPGQMLVLAHTEELVDQNLTTLRLANPSLRIDKEMAEHKADPSTADIIMASVPTLGRKNTSRLMNYVIEKWDKIFVDEAHHTAAESYKNVLNAFHVLEDGTPKLLVGWTATPQRADGKALCEFYKKQVYTYSLRQAIEDERLVKIRAYRVVTQTSIANVSMAGGDLAKIELELAIDCEERNKLVVKAWKERCENRKTVVYSAGIEHAKHLAEAFKEGGIQAEAIWGTDIARKEKLQWHRNTFSSVLVNAQLLTEGYDDPSIACIVIAAPTASSVKFTQMCGRATRLFPGKVDCIILDVIDIAGNHSLCTLPMLLGLPANLDIQGHGLVEAIQMIEAMQEENPAIDFARLKTIEDIKQFIEEINLFEVRFPKEVEDNSDFRWTKAVDGAYVIKVPKLSTDTTDWKAGNVRIYQNILDKWEISGIINTRGFHGLRNSLEESFKIADQQIRERAPASVILLNRKASWTTKPATKNQITMLSRLYGKGKVWPEGFTQGQASHWIDKRIGGK